MPQFTIVAIAIWVHVSLGLMRSNADLAMIILLLVCASFLVVSVCLYYLLFFFPLVLKTGIIASISHTYLYSNGEHIR